MVLRLSVIVQVSSFSSGFGGALLLSVAGKVHVSGARRWWPVEAMKRRAEIFEHGFKAAVQGSTAAHQHIITMGAHGQVAGTFHQFAKPAANAVAFRRRAVFPGHGKADPNRAVIIAKPALKHEGRTAHPRPIGNGEEVRSLP
jgi:hypothetical protein